MTVRGLESLPFRVRLYVVLSLPLHIQEPFLSIYLSIGPSMTTKRNGKDHIVWASLTDREIGRLKRLIYMYRQRSTHDGRKLELTSASIRACRTISGVSPMLPISRSVATWIESTSSN